MKKRIVDLRGGRAVPLLDIVSFGRRGPAQGRPLTQAEIAHVARTARRVPEVMIKVSGGARSMCGVAQHLDYIGRKGEGTIETDDGVMHQGKGSRRRCSRTGTLTWTSTVGIQSGPLPQRESRPGWCTTWCSPCPRARRPDKLHEAVRRLAMEKFALQHRYAMALHMDRDIRMYMWS